MSYAQLGITYEKTLEGAGPDYDYLMRTTVRPVATTPSSLYVPLVVHKGDKTADELLHEVGDRDQIILNPLDALPTLVNRFSADSFTTFANGDYIIIAIVDLPIIWSRLYSQVTELRVEVIDATDPTDVFVDSPYFPAFGRELSFSVERSSTVIHTAEDGVANRDYTAVSGNDYLASDHADVWDNYDDAANKYESLRAEAQSLVDAMNADHFSGTDQENYE